ncbi:MAG: PIN domain-containing protein [Pirellulales bacterium]
MAADRTFLDANVLLLAFRGSGDKAVAASSLLNDESREFIASDMLRLELLPKPDFNKRPEEVRFFEAYFQYAEVVVTTTPTLVQNAEREARAAGLSTIDALHVAAAKQANADELVTAELPTKPLFRVQGLRITSIA